MNKQSLVKIIIVVILIPTILLGAFWLVKNRGIFSTALQRVVTTGVNDQDSSRSELLAQLKEKESQYKKINDQIVSVQNTCSSIDLEKVGKKEINAVNKENFTQTVGGYYTCEAVKAKDTSRCDFLKDVSDGLFRSCVMNTVNIGIASEKCSAQSMSRCTQSGLFTQSDCNNVCSLYGKSEASICSVIKDPDLNKGCLAFAQKNVSLCNGIVDDTKKAACINEYYLYSAIRSNSAETLNKIEEGFKRSIGKVVFDGSISCKEEFSKFIQQADCASGLVGNYEDIQRQANVLKGEIEDLNRKLQGIVR